MTTNTAEDLRLAEKTVEAAIDALDAPRDAWITEATATAAAWTLAQARLYVVNQADLSVKLGKPGVAGLHARVDALVQDVRTSLPGSLRSVLTDPHNRQAATGGAYGVVRPLTNSVFEKTVTRSLATILKEAGYSTASSRFHKSRQWYSEDAADRTSQGPDTPSPDHDYIRALEDVRRAQIKVDELQQELTREEAARLWDN
ncbi:hypothetical protein ACFWEJ_12580 [Promicromonospora sp. NPDC060204]|uniref:hypothetical protein n=1 Tax=Promicromonospora sp. NPDC060204 TaxID=3347071 RepID=UPI0036637983